MVDGLWTVEFSSSLGLAGKGVLVIEDNRLLGGDAGYYYHGTFNLEKGNFTGELTITRYDKTSISVFGNRDKFSFGFTGKLLQDDFEIKASFGEYKFQARGKKQKDF